MIRRAIDADFEPLFAMCREFWKAGGPLPEFDEDYTREKLRLILGSCPVLVSVDSGLITGMLILTFTEHLCAPLVNCGEVAWYVRPEHRKGGVGLELLREGIQLARESGAHTMTFVYMQASMPDVIKSIYESLGFVESERTYLKRL